MLSSHSIRAVAVALALAVPCGASAQPAPLGAGATSFTIFLRGTPIGNEQVALTRVADGWTIVASGRLGAPIDVIGRRVQVRYTPDWRPIEFLLDATVRGQPQTVRTIVEGTAAKSETPVEELLAATRLGAASVPWSHRPFTGDSCCRAPLCSWHDA